MKQLMIFLTLLGFAIAGRSQQDSTLLASADSSGPKSTLTIGLSIVNNADYYGQRSEESMPYTAVVASYQHRSGFSINALSYRLLSPGNEGFASAYGAGLGYAVPLKKNWTTEFGYQYTFFPKHSPFLQAANPHTATASVTKEAAVTTRLEGNYSFGTTHDFFSTLAVSKQVPLFSFSKKDVVIFTPQFDVTGGTQRFYSYYVKEKTIRDSLAGTLLDPIFGRGNESRTDTAVQTVTSFDLLSYNVKLPIAYNRANYLIELSTQFSLLSNKAQMQPGRVNAFLTASFYYQF